MRSGEFPPDVLGFVDRGPEPLVFWVGQVVSTPRRVKEA